MFRTNMKTLNPTRRQKVWGNDKYYSSYRKKNVQLKKNQLLRNS